MAYQVSLKSARVNAGYTQEEAAKLAKVCRSTIVAWENGKTFPTAIQLRALCEIYQVPLGNIFLPRV